MTSMYPVDPRGLERITRELLDGTSTEEPRDPPLDSASVKDPQNYIILPKRKHGTYEYPNLLVAKTRESLGMDWTQAMASLKQGGDYALTPRQFVDFLKLLKSGKAVDGNGRNISPQELLTMYKDVTEQRDPYRAEWLNAKFAKQGKSLVLVYDTPQGEKSEPLQECLMSDKTPGIDLDQLLQNANPQGLPPKNTANGTLYYWYPRENRVAWFWAISGRVFLGCGSDPAGSDPELGVRRAKIFRGVTK